MATESISRLKYIPFSTSININLGNIQNRLIKNNKFKKINIMT